MNATAVVAIVTVSVRGLATVTWSAESLWLGGRGRRGSEELAAGGAMGMKAHETISKRFQDLNEEAKRIPKDTERDRVLVDRPAWEKWATEVLSLLEGAFGRGSPHCRNFQNIYDGHNGSYRNFLAAMGVFQAAHEDFLGGYIFNLESEITGAVLGSFVLLARAALDEGHKDVAAVLAAAALEDGLKRYGAANGLEVENKSMQEVINALKGARLLAGAKRSLLDPMPKLRDFAMHANWARLTAPDVAGIVGFVDAFLVENF